MRIAVKQLKADWLIVMTNREDGKAALTRGLNLEDTRLTSPHKLATLLSILAMAISWAYRCATQTIGL